MSTRLVALGVALALISGAGAALSTPGTTEELNQQHFTDASAPRETFEAPGMTADLGLLADVVTEARKDVRLGADPVATVERLTSTQSVAFSSSGFAGLSAEAQDACSQGKTVWGLSFDGSIVDRCVRSNIYTSWMGSENQNAVLQSWTVELTGRYWTVFGNPETWVKGSSQGTLSFDQHSFSFQVSGETESTRDVAIPAITGSGTWKKWSDDTMTGYGSDPDFQVAGHVYDSGLAGGCVYATPDRDDGETNRYYDAYGGGWGSCD